LCISFCKQLFLKSDITDDPKPSPFCDVLDDPDLRSLAEALKVYSVDLSRSCLPEKAVLTIIKSRIEDHIQSSLKQAFRKKLLNNI
jgi:hypothetical protein